MIEVNPINQVILLETNEFKIELRPVVFKIEIGQVGVPQVELFNLLQQNGDLVLQQNGDNIKIRSI